MSHEPKPADDLVDHDLVDRLPESLLDEDELDPATIGASTIREVLRRAAHSMTQADERWSDLRRRGADDATLARQLASEFGSYGGSSSPIWHQYHGGEHPRLVIGWHPRTLTLSGSRLLSLARSVLEIPSPNDALQGRLF